MSYDLFYSFSASTTATTTIRIRSFISMVRWLASYFIHYVVHFGRTGNETRIRIAAWYTTQSNAQKRVTRTSILEYEKENKLIFYLVYRTRYVCVCVCRKQKYVSDKF